VDGGLRCGHGPTVTTKSRTACKKLSLDRVEEKGNRERHDARLEVSAPAER
jgi:hypothetical protein